MKKYKVILMYVLLTGVILFQLFGIPAVVHEVLDLQKNQIIQIVE